MASGPQMLAINAPRPTDRPTRLSKSICLVTASSFLLPTITNTFLTEDIQREAVTVRLDRTIARRPQSLSFSAENMG